MNKLIDITNMSDAELAELLDNATRERERRANGGFTTAELKAAFDAVADPDDWRGPIDAIIDNKDREVTAAAIGFYCATEAEFYCANDEEGDKLRVTSVGYRMGPAGP